ncbi:MAG TPA: ABC transporter substrate-binding protein [Caulobacteraceae bacterium]|nr:ABC transporter substrate-binding protein [Caulobacteraceae bacterium]
MAASLPLAHAAAALAVVAAAGPAVAAQPSDPAAAQIARFDTALTHAATLPSAAARAKALTPAVGAAFDIPAMTGFAVGPAWSGVHATDRTMLAAAFKRLVAANYAKNFSGPGTQFVIAPEVAMRGADKLVQVHIGAAPSSGALVIYRMHRAGVAWRVVDVLFNGSVSELTTERTEFAPVWAAGGAHALAAHMDAETEKLLR